MRKLKLLGLLLIPAVLLTACGKGGDGDNTPAETEAPKNASELVEEWMADATETQSRQLDSTEIDEGATPLDSLEYTVRDDGTAAITKFKGTETDVIITSHIGEAPVTEIAQYAFEGAWDVQTITLPDSIQTIGEQAFLDCSSMTAINLPEGIPELYRGTFAGCSSLVELTIPKSVKSTQEELLSGCLLTDLYILNKDLEYVSWGLEDCDPPCTIHAPAGAKILKWAEKNDFPTEEE